MIDRLKQADKKLATSDEALSGWQLDPIYMDNKRLSRADRGRALGNMIPNIKIKLLAPEAREAVTYSNSLILRNSARVIRATAVQLTAPIAIVIIVRDAPKRATITIANSRVIRKKEEWMILTLRS